MASQAELIRAITAGQQQTLRIRQSTVRLVERAWNSLGSYRDADIERFVRFVVPIMNAGQRQVSMMTVAQLQALEQLATGTRTRVTIPPEAVTTEGLRGVQAEEVYRRPAVTTWTALSNDVLFAEAVERGRQRLTDIATTGLQLAKTHTAQRVLAGADNVVGYRRTLGGPKNCGMCAIASTQRYHKSDLLPIHPGCDCGVTPIYGDADPGQVINEERLAATHEAIAEQFGTDNPAGVGYRDIMIHDHGELGPVLTIRGQRFTGPADI